MHVVNEKANLIDTGTPALEGEVIAVEPERRIHLKTPHDVRKEMRRVYIDVRQGRLDSSEGSKLTYMLASILKAVDSEREGDRTEAIERVLKIRKAEDESKF